MHGLCLHMDVQCKDIDPFRDLYESQETIKASQIPSLLAFIPHQRSTVLSSLQLTFNFHFFSRLRLIRNRLQSLLHIFNFVQPTSHLQNVLQDLPRCSRGIPSCCRPWQDRRYGKCPVFFSLSTNTNRSSRPVMLVETPLDSVSRVVLFQAQVPTRLLRSTQLSSTPSKPPLMVSERPRPAPTPWPT